MTDERNDEALSKLMRAVRAEADPVLWTRVRARLVADEAPIGGLIGWLMRPAALATSVAALVIAALLSFRMLDGVAPASYANATGITDALLGVDESPIDRWAPEIGADIATPADSGVTS